MIELSGPDEGDVTIDVPVLECSMALEDCVFDWQISLYMTDGSEVDTSLFELSADS